MMIVVSNVNDTKPAAPSRILQTEDDGTIAVRITVESESFIS